MTNLTHSLSMRLFLIFGLVALCFHTSYAHTYLSSVILDGEALAEGDCVRSHPLTAYDSPITFLNSTNMTCGFLPQSAQTANRKCPITAGSSIGIQWHHQSTAATDDIIDVSHLGPILFYLAKSDSGAGNVWFKIYEDGYTAADGQWAVNRLINNGGKVTFTIPSDISPGNYLLRGELLALHNGYALDGVQPYVGCVELTIAGSGSSNPAGVAFPGYYKDTDPGMLFNIYSAFTSYPIPGPAIYTSSSSASSSSSGTASSSSGSTTPTTAPTSAPPSNPTTAPPSNPTTAPPSNPTTAPPSSPTTAPPSSPTTAPAGNIQIGLHSGTSAWWVGVVVSGGGETTVKVELTDSGSITSWTALVDNSYAFVFSESIQVTPPISIRLTSSTGKVVTVTNAFTSLTASTSLIDTGKAYSTATTSTTAPTSKPTTKPTTAPTQPTTAPTSKPTTAPTSGASSGSNAKVTIYSGSSAWWFAVTVSGTTSTISKVELKDSGALTAFTAMTNNQWAYTFATQGTALVAPLTVRVTSSSGQAVTTTVTSITPGTVLETSGPLL
jgi:cellulase